MHIVFGTRSWKANATLGGIIILTALVGAVAVDWCLHSRRVQAAGTGTPIIMPADMTRFMAKVNERLPAGSLAADFDLPAVGEGPTFQLSRHRGVGPVVLVFGSFSCDLFQGQIPELRRIYDRHKDHATFIFIAVREAGHRLPGYEFLLEGAKAEDGTKRFQLRRDCVDKAMRMSALPIPGYLDLPDDSVCLAYNAWPRRLVLVDRDGRIAQDFGPGLGPMWDLGELGRMLDAREPTRSVIGN
jgi:hypothetical protein